MNVQIIGGPYRVAYDGAHVIEVNDGQVVELLPETCEAWIKQGKAKLPGTEKKMDPAPVENKMDQPPANKAVGKAVDASPLVPPHKRRRK